MRNRNKKKFHQLLECYYNSMQGEELLVFFASKWFKNKRALVTNSKKIHNADYDELRYLLEDKIMRYLFVAYFISMYDLKLDFTKSEEIERFVDEFKSVDSLIDFCLWNTEELNCG